MAVINVHPSKDVSVSNYRIPYWYSWGYIYQAGKSYGVDIGSWDWADKPWANVMADKARSLMKFDMPTLPYGAVLSSAKLHVYISRNDNMHSFNNGYYSYPANITLDVHRMTQNWDEGTGDGQHDGYQYTGATWTYAGPNVGYWNAYGGSYDPTPSVSITVPYNSQNLVLDITSLINWWNANPTQNYGLMIKLRDETPGAHLAITSKDASPDGAPYIEFNHSIPPQKSRGLSPNYNATISPQIPGSQVLRWKFIDAMLPPPSGSKGDVVFLIDVTGSTSGFRSRFYEQINNHVQKMINAGVQWQAAIVTFGDLDWGEPFQVYNFTNDFGQLRRNLDSIYWQYGGDYPESDLEGALRALDLSYRSDAYAQMLIITDAEAKETRNSIVSVANTMKAKGIKVSVACPGLWQYNTLTSITGGQLLDYYGSFGSAMDVYAKYTPPVNMPMPDSGDWQSRADITLSKINNDGSRSTVGVYTVTGTQEWLDISGIVMQDSASYEWSIVTWNQNNLQSPVSNKAIFKYNLLPTYTGLPTWSPLPQIGKSINHTYLDEIKNNLRNETVKYIGVDTADIDSLFVSTIPSKTDYEKLGKTVKTLYDKHARSYDPNQLLTPTFGITAIQRMRNAIIDLANLYPDAPAAGTSRLSAGQLSAPSAVHARNDTAYDTSIDVSWTAPAYLPSGLNVNLPGSPDANVYYYKVYYEQHFGDKVFYYDLAFTPDQVASTLYFLLDEPCTYRVMYYRAFDKNNRGSDWVSVSLAAINGIASSAPVGVSSYQVQYQPRYWYATEPDPNGSWTLIWQWTPTSLVHWVGGTASHWYRVRAVDANGNPTPWTYSTDIAYTRS